MNSPSPPTYTSVVSPVRKMRTSATGPWSGRGRSASSESSGSRRSWSSVTSFERSRRKRLGSRRNWFSITNTKSSWRRWGGWIRSDPMLCIVVIKKVDEVPTAVIANEVKPISKVWWSALLFTKGSFVVYFWIYVYVYERNDYRSELRRHTYHPTHPARPLPTDPILGLCVKYL